MHIDSAWGVPGFSVIRRVAKEEPVASVFDESESAVGEDVDELGGGWTVLAFFDEPWRLPRCTSVA